MSSAKASNVRAPARQAAIAPKSPPEFTDIRIKVAGRTKKFFTKKFVVGKIVRSYANKPLTFKISFRKGFSRWRDREELLQTYITFCTERVSALADEALSNELEELQRTPDLGDSIWRHVLPALGARPASSAALERAFARADESHAALANRTDMVTGDAIAERLRLSRATVDNRRNAGKLLALELGTKRGVRYPEWQCEFLTDPSTRSAYESTLRTLGSMGAPAKYRFFTQAAPALGGRTPIEALRAGEYTGVADAARTWRAGEQGGG